MHTACHDWTIDRRHRRVARQCCGARVSLFRRRMRLVRTAHWQLRKPFRHPEIPSRPPRRVVALRTLFGGRSGGTSLACTGSRV